MSISPTFVHELRTLFKQGATPSKLIRQILLRHPQEHHWRQLVQDYFWEAFAVPLVRMPTKPHDLDQLTLRYAHFNRHLVHQMIQMRPKWDVNYGGDSSSENSWLNGLPATDDLALREQADPTIVPELADAWASFDPKAQKYIKELMGSFNALYERVVILAQLAECLQGQVAEAERPSALTNDIRDESPP
jgi:hypothetical protein